MNTQRSKNYIWAFAIAFTVAIGFASGGEVYSMQNKVDICHCPAGDLDKCVTLTVGEAGAAAHFRQHPNDSTGACPCVVDSDCGEPQCFANGSGFTVPKCDNGLCLVAAALCPPDISSVGCVDGELCVTTISSSCNPDTIQCEETTTTACNPDPFCQP